MERPSHIEQRLADIVEASGLHIEYRQTGTDTAETFWYVTDANGKKHEFVGGIPASLIIMKPNWRSVFQVRDEIIAKVAHWKAFVKSNEHELAEYKRLKEKFSGL